MGYGLRSYSPTSVSALRVAGPVTLASTLSVAGASTLTGSVALGANADLTMAAGGQIFADSGAVGAPGISIGGATTGFFSSGAGTVNTAVGGGQATLTNSSGMYVYIPLGMASHIDMYEIAAPAGTTDVARLFAVVDGGAKTDLKVIFQSGAAIVMDQEV